MIKKMDHLVITTSQPENVMSFYEKLGFTAKKAEGRLELLAGDFKINVHIKGSELYPHAENITPGSADLCFEADGNIDCMKASLIAKGIEIELGVVDRNGVWGKMKSIYMRDPDHNLVEICCYE